ncbi:uncharacterized protein L969DRAFT_47526 [Mixia osmundae IAM 14324]|uniref:Inorganic phosphate transport PHO88 n=1 Tax=Mixia osmundae (strain CBS 9802 / IAM 14324 / JCM 22182 / KY 12970) TaxID=764103 RepID=G7DVF8_MIXOS|nr:uncharacterized protein L969DRAFT_47526 [Mixia osmundae IAM 14324]KEI40346.1 hypothetical protein L969DRAFT_47526 [Mixia osmundae IAM 14324]GAA94568.1 hypothetical protein E5Q_01220 [Mixia osmundae IAM 14324]
MVLDNVNPAIKNLGVTLILMQVARKIDFDRPDVLFGVRCLYVFSQLFILGVYYYVSIKIKSKNDQTLLKYIEPKTPGSQEPGVPVSTTYRDYDLAETSKQVRQVLIGIAMMCFLHGYMKYTQPLFLQSLMPMKAALEAKIVQLHLFGQPATGELKRPFKVGGLMGAADPVTDKAAIKQAEKTRAARKDE